VTGLGDALLQSAPEGVPLLLDGDAGTMVVDPPSDLVADYQERSRARAEAAEAARAAAAAPAVTRDGCRVEVAANVASPREVSGAVAAGADGVGLLRTEFLFLDRESPPDEEEQVATYRAVCAGVDGRPVVLRTLDVGGDKPLPWLEQPEEPNPFLGLRGIRLGLARPAVLTTQLRAALLVAAEYPLRLMFPLVTTLKEYRVARGLVDQVAGELRAAGRTVPERPEIGVMVEVPALALAADRVAPHVDFFSIGTNDLAQYVFAAERGNPRVAGLADPLHPALLGLVRRVVEAAQPAGRWVGVCGEIAAEPAAAGLLFGLGVRELSVPPPAVPGVKQAVRGVDAREAEGLARAALQLDSAAAVRALLPQP
jgi:phosphoenolpyruvate-protein phosphotransferase